MDIRRPTLRCNYKISDEIMCKMSSLEEAFKHSDDDVRDEDEKENESHLSLNTTQQCYSLGRDEMIQKHKLQKE